MRSKSYQATMFIVFTGVFAALATILYLFEFPIIPGLSYLQIDLGDLPAAIAGVMLGPIAALSVELIKCAIHVAIRGLGTTMGFGDLINFIVGTALTVPLSILLRAALKKKGVLLYVLAGAAGIASMAAAGVIFNYLIDPPFFRFVLHINLSGAALWSAIGGATVLNLIKSVVTFLLVILMIPVIRKIKLPDLH